MRPTIRPPALLLTPHHPKYRPLEFRYHPTFTVRPLHPHQHTALKRRNDIVLRNIFNKLGAELMQGRRLRFEEHVKKACPFVTEGQLLAAIDTSVALRWVPRFEDAEKWIGRDDDACEEKSGEKQQGDSALENDSGAFYAPVPLTIARTAVHRNFLRPESLLGRPAVAPGAFITSTPAVMRARRRHLLAISRTHDLVLLGIPSQVYARLSLKDPSSILSSYMNGSLHAEGLNDALGFPLPASDALEQKVDATRAELKQVTDKLAKAAMQEKMRKSKRNGGGASGNKSRNALSEQFIEDDGDDANVGGGEDDEETSMEERSPSALGSKEALQREYWRQKQLWYVRKTIAESIVRGQENSGGGGGDSLEVDAGPVVGSFGSDTNIYDGAPSGHLARTAATLLASERELFDQLVQSGEAGTETTGGFFTRPKLHDGPELLRRRSLEAFTTRLDSTVDPSMSASIIGRRGDGVGMHTRIAKHTGILGRTFDATRSVLSVSDMLRSRRRIPFETAVLDFQAQAPCFVLVHFLVSKLRTQTLTRKKITAMFSFDSGEQNPQISSAPSSPDALAMHYRFPPSGLRAYFASQVMPTVARCRVPFPVSTHILQMFSCVPHAAGDLTLLIRAVVRPMMVQQQQQHQQRDSDTNSPSSPLMFSAPSMGVSLCTRTIIDREIAPIFAQMFQDGGCASSSADAIEAAARRLFRISWLRWRSGGHVGALVIATNSALGFTDFVAAQPTERTARECVQIAKALDVEAAVTRDAADSSVPPLDSDSLLAATGPRIDHRSTDSAAQQQQQQQQQYRRAPLVTMVGESRVLENIVVSALRARRNGIPSTSPLWAAPTKPSKANVNEGTTTTNNGSSVLRMPASDSSLSSSSSHCVFVPASLVHHVRSLDELCRVSGWASEFGAHCAPELLRRFLVGAARDALGVASFHPGGFQLREGFNVAQRRHACVFAVPVAGEKGSGSLSSVSNRSAASEISQDDDADGDAEATTHFAVFVPDEERADVMTPFRHVVENAVRMEQRRVLRERDGREEDDDDDCDDDERSGASSSSASSAAHRERDAARAAEQRRRFLAVQIDARMCVFVISE